MEVVEAKLLKEKGRMEELRQFVAKRVKSAGNRAGIFITFFPADDRSP